MTEAIPPHRRAQRARRRCEADGAHARVHEPRGPARRRERARVGGDAVEADREAPAEVLHPETTKHLDGRVQRQVGRPATVLGPQPDLIVRDVSQVAQRALHALRDLVEVRAPRQIGVVGSGLKGVVYLDISPGDTGRIRRVPRQDAARVTSRSSSPPPS